MSRVPSSLSAMLVACLVCAGGLCARGAVGEEGAKKGRKTPEQRFQSLDRNGDGQLDLDEFKRTRKKDTPEQAEATFKRLDKDAGGTLSLEEFAASGAVRKRSQPQPAVEPTSEEDLAAIQGTWVRTTETDDGATRRITKQVEGNKELVTYYDGEGSVQRAHTATIKLDRAGPIKVFTFSNVTYTAGPQVGEKEEGAKAYIYKVVGDTFIEIWGVLGDEDTQIRALRWERQ